MKIDRSQVELVLADATSDPVSRWHVNDTFNRELVAELARAWLALDDAPEADGFHYSRPPMRAVTGVCFDGIDLIRFAGKRVRLVATSGGDGNA